MKRFGSPSITRRLTPTNWKACSLQTVTATASRHGRATTVLCLVVVTSLFLCTAAAVTTSERHHRQEAESGHDEEGDVAWRRRDMGEYDISGQRSRPAIHLGIEEEVVDHIDQEIVGMMGSDSTIEWLTGEGDADDSQRRFLWKAGIEDVQPSPDTPALPKYVEVDEESTSAQNEIVLKPAAQQQPSTTPNNDTLNGAPLTSRSNGLLSLNEPSLIGLKGEAQRGSKVNNAPLEYKAGSNAELFSDVNFRKRVLLSVNQNSVPVAHAQLDPTSDGNATLTRAPGKAYRENIGSEPTRGRANLVASATNVVAINTRGNVVSNDTKPTVDGLDNRTTPSVGPLPPRRPRLSALEGSSSSVLSFNCSAVFLKPEKAPGIHLVTIRWGEIGVYFSITAFVIFAGLGKLGFHQLAWLSSKVPESCLLIVLGFIMGVVIHFAHPSKHVGGCSDHAVEFPTFTSPVFFFVLLPPIILESAYSLHDRSFMDNIGTVLVFAVFGTLLNIFIIGPSLYGLAAGGAMGNFNLTMTESLVFSSLISAVDPVAVLNIFQDLGVNKGLYFLVFGESLLNDGVTVVVYNTLSVFMKMPKVQATDYVLSVVAFFVVTLCGALIGVFYGFVTALVTRVTTSVRVVEPLALLGIAYLAYLSAEMFHFSGIISLVCCGLVQAHYAFRNISGKSYTCVKYFTKMASATSETVIFMFLGMVLVKEINVWHTGFVLWTLALCFIVRFIVTLGLSAVSNRYRTHVIGTSEQLILAYGGLRGAVAFSLVIMLPETLAVREHFVTATLSVIIFTVFLQGITIGPLVNWLDVSKQRSGEKLLLEEVHVSVMDHTMTGIEEVLGRHGDFYLRERMVHYNDKYLMRWFVRPTCEAPLQRLFEKNAISDHFAHLYGPVVLMKQQRLRLSAGSRKISEKTPLTCQDNALQCLETSCNDLPQDPANQKEAMANGGLVEIRSGVRLRSDPKELKINVAASQDTGQDDARILRRAISSNPYNQLHYTYNRNLVNADEQEISDHLHRRRRHAKHLNRLASQTSLPGPPNLHAPRPDTPFRPTLNKNAWVAEGAPPTAQGAVATVIRKSAGGGGGLTDADEVKVEDEAHDFHVSETDDMNKEP